MASGNNNENHCSLPEVPFLHSETQQSRGITEHSLPSNLLCDFLIAPYNYIFHLLVLICLHLFLRVSDFDCKLVSKVRTDLLLQFRAQCNAIFFYDEPSIYIVVICEEDS